MAGASVIRAISFRQAPQWGQRRTSISNTRFINSAQVYLLLFRSAPAGLDFDFRRRKCRITSSGFGFGTKAARNAALGANTGNEISPAHSAWNQIRQKTTPVRSGVKVTRQIPFSCSAPWLCPSNSRAAR